MHYEKHMVRSFARKGVGSEGAAAPPGRAQQTQWGLGRVEVRVGGGPLPGEG